MRTVIAKHRSAADPKSANAVRVVCMSDTHTKHPDPASVPPGDVFVCAGDFTYTGMLQEIRSFCKFLDALPHAHKIVVSGNHEITLDYDYYMNRGRRRFHGNHRIHEDAILCKSVLSASCTYLQDSSVEIAGLKIYGSPWQPSFCDWAFNMEPPELKRKWAEIPDDVDVLITHGPPKGHGARIVEGFDVGCPHLMDRVNQVKPMLHVFGHIHEGYGVTANAHTLFVNASTCTRRYEATNPPIVVDVCIQ